MSPPTPGLHGAIEAEVEPGRRCVIWGAGGHGGVVLDLLLQRGAHPLGFLDDSPQGRGRLLHGYPVLGSFEEQCDRLRDEDAAIFLGIGDNAARRRTAELAASAGFEVRSVRHHTSAVSPLATVGPGCVLVAQCAINAGARVGRGVIVNTCASVGHDVEVGDFAHVAPGVNLTGHCVIGAGAFIAAGSTVIPRVRIGEGTVVGAHSLVVRDLPPHTMCVGHPARVIRRLDT